MNENGYIAVKNFAGMRNNWHCRSFFRSLH